MPMEEKIHQLRQWIESSDNIVFFGGAGALFGMVVFNHKTSKMKFRIFVPLFFWLNYFMSVDAFSLLKKILSYILQIMKK